MTKKLTLALTAAAALLTVSAYAQSVDEIVAKNIAARGGADKLKAVKAVKMYGKMKMGPMEAPFIITESRPNKIRTDFTIQNATATTAFDGTTGWTLMPFLGKTEAEKMSADELKSVKTDADIDGPFLDYKAKGTTIEMLGKEDVKGSPAYKLKITAKDGVERTLYVDATSFLEVKSESKRKMQGQEMEGITYIGDYKAVDGVMYPFSMQSTIKGMENMGGQSIVIEKVTVNPTIDASTFAMPAPKAAAPAPAAAEPKKQ
jgi:outer membrane lipoprotein-sorting protein